VNFLNLRISPCPEELSLLLEEMVDPEQEIRRAVKIRIEWIIDEFFIDINIYTNISEES
jgi:hypothetical protein